MFPTQSERQRWIDKCTRLEQENERLRAALRDIVDRFAYLQIECDAMGAKMLGTYAYAARMSVNAVLAAALDGGEK